MNPMPTRAQQSQLLRLCLRVVKFASSTSTRHLAASSAAQAAWAVQQQQGRQQQHSSRCCALLSREDTGAPACWAGPQSAPLLSPWLRAHLQQGSSTAARLSGGSESGGQRWHGTSGSDNTPASAAPPPDPSVRLTEDVHYQGPLASTHKLLKRISIANTAIAFAAAPLIIMYAEVSYMSRVGLASSLVIFGVLTTAALHWITRPYVHELKFNAATQELEARMTTLFGRSRVEHFKLGDVQPLPWNRPVATFMANGNFYYVDVYSFPDEALLHRLTPPEDSVPPGYKDDKDDD